MANDISKDLERKFKGKFIYIFDQWIKVSTVELHHGSYYVSGVIVRINGTGIGISPQIREDGVMVNPDQADILLRLVQPDTVEGVQDYLTRKIAAFTQEVEKTMTQFGEVSAWLDMDGKLVF